MEARKHDLISEIQFYGVKDERVLQSMKTVPRHEFVPPMLKTLAYENHCLPIGKGQTISQPLIVASMAEAAEIGESDVVLEVGSGCGYNAAVLSRLAYKVYTTEIIPELVDLARKNIERVGYTNVVVVHSNGSVGYPEYAPYDAIVVTASAPSIPSALLEQLAEGGRLIIPVYSAFHGYDKLTKVTRVSGSEYRHVDLGAVQFVPLTGEAGHKPAGAPETDQESGDEITL